MTLADVAELTASERSMTTYTGGQDCHECPTREQIARLAYDFYVRRGRRDGHDVDDWMAAELALMRPYRSTTQTGPQS